MPQSTYGAAGAARRIKTAARACADADQTLSGLPGTVDGVSAWAAGEVILLTAQTDSSENGLWVVGAGAWSRTSDLGDGSTAAGVTTWVHEGVIHGNQNWACTNDTGAGDVGTDDLTWAAAGGGGATGDAGGDLGGTYPDPSIKGKAIDRVNAMLVQMHAMYNLYRTVRQYPGRLHDTFYTEDGVDTAASTAMYDSGSKHYQAGAAIINSPYSVSAGGAGLGRVAAVDHVMATFVHAYVAPANVGDLYGTYYIKAAQSFTIGSAANIDKVTATLRRMGTDPGDLRVEIQTDSLGNPSGTLAHANATATIASTTISTSGYNSTEFAFAAAAPLSAGTTYWLVWDMPNGDPGSDQFVMFYGNSYSDQYPDGNAAQWITAWADVNYDLAFTVEVAFPEQFQDQVSQSFTPTASLTGIDRGAVYLKKTLTPGDITARIETDNSGEPSGTLAHANATGTIIESAVTGSHTNIPITFDGEFPLTAATKYWLVLSLAADPGIGEFYQAGDYPYSAAGNFEGEAAFHPDGSLWYVDAYIRDWAFELLSSATPFVQSLASTASVQPDEILAVWWRKETGGDTGTLTIEVSRDGGVTWTTATGILADEDEQTTTDAYYAIVDVSAQPAGTDVRIKANISGDSGEVAISAWGMDYNE